ncbi:hypothetical protein HJC23_008688 [Cyclotella cryptica]|uniref:Uncharacterized protein n=1 Tax=Cyclotella cryptica TaxID=29204 RepID=A0ABD3QIC0_9STRA
MAATTSRTMVPIMSGVTPISHLSAVSTSKRTGGMLMVWYGVLYGTILYTVGVSAIRRSIVGQRSGVPEIVGGGKVTYHVGMQADLFVPVDS